VVDRDAVLPAPGDDLFAGVVYLRPRREENGDVRIRMGEGQGYCVLGMTENEEPAGPYADGLSVRIVRRSGRQHDGVSFLRAYSRAAMQ
jgi:hypothetical protein